MEPGTNFIHVRHRDTDALETFFGPSPEATRTVWFDDNWTMADIVVEAGLVPSKTQARKQGLDKSIEVGFNIVREKRKHHHKNFWILN